MSNQILKPLPTPSPPALSKSDHQGEYSDARLSAVVEAAYILEAIRR
jgi:hypothetical protein